MPVTIREIARALNLAVSTVSKALQDSYEISDETKQLVREYARKKNYVPNPYAGSLKHRRSRNIAVVVPEVADTYFSNAINGIDTVAQENGYHVIVYLTHESADREREILMELKSGRVDGVLISVSNGVRGDVVEHSELALKLPVVYFDRVCDNVHAAKVVTNDFEAAALATSHLIENGCRSVLFLSSGNELSIIKERRAGFESIVKSTAFTSRESQVLICPDNASESKALISEIIQSRKDIDGIIASVEKLAMQTYEACREHSIAIPSRMKIIAFSNLAIANLLSPPLTTIVQPASQMGTTAANILFKALAKRKAVTPQTIVLPSLLIARESTGAF